MLKPICASVTQKAHHQFIFFTVDSEIPRTVADNVARAQTVCVHSARVSFLLSRSGRDVWMSALENLFLSANLSF